MYKNWLLSGQKAFFDVYLVLVFGRIVIFLCDDLMKTIKKGLGIVLYERYAKRVIDLVLGIVILMVLSPVFLILMILIKLDSRGPVFFRQKRVGRDKEYFSILKFRTMRTDAPKDMPTHLLQNPDAFITRVGKFLRKTSLDELPQLLNIIKGDMSFIGPRPALWNQFDLISRVSSKVQKKFINSQRSCLSVGFSHFYGCFRHRTPFFSNIMLWICP